MPRAGRRGVWRAIRGPIAPAAGRPTASASFSARHGRAHRRWVCNSSGRSPRQPGAASPSGCRSPTPCAAHSPLTASGWPTRRCPVGMSSGANIVVARLIRSRSTPSPRRRWIPCRRKERSTPGRYGWATRSTSSPTATGRRTSGNTMSRRSSSRSSRITRTTTSRRSTRGAASLSPSGARALFSARGEVFSVPAEKGDARNLTRSPGTAERTPVWSPDGKQVAWFSDASGEYRLMIGTQEGLSAPREIRFEQPTFFHTADWSPDGKYIAVTDEGLNMLLVEVATGKVTRLDTDTSAHPERTFEPAWSPDSKWLAYAKRLPSQFHVLMAYSMTDRKSYQLTDGLSDALSPTWDAGGKYLYFLASTDFGLSSGWLDLSSYDRHMRRGAYLMVLAADTPSPLLPESDEEARDTTSGKGVDTTKAKAAVRVRIDRTGLSQRILALGMPVRAYTSLVAANEGVVFVSEAIENQTGVTLHRYDLKKRKSESFVSPVTRFRLSRDGKKRLYQSGESWMIVGTETVPKAGDGKITVDLQMRLDPRAEWRQIFREAWRFERDYLYVPNHNGADWDKVWTMYEPWLGSVGHRSDLTYLLDMLGGELSLGHTFVFGGDTPAIDTVKIGMLGADFAVENGRYRLKRIFSGENWNPNLRAP